MPAFLKLHRTDIAQRPMNSAVVVERHPVNDFVHGLPACREFSAVQPAHFQPTAEALRRGVVPTIARATHRAFHLVARKC